MRKVNRKDPKGIGSDLKQKKNTESKERNLKSKQHNNRLEGREEVESRASSSSYTIPFFFFLSLCSWQPRDWDSQHAPNLCVFGWALVTALSWTPIYILSSPRGYNCLVIPHLPYILSTSHSSFS